MLDQKNRPDSQTESLSGAEFLADQIVAQGVDHVFFVDAVLRETLIELEKRGVRRILAHSEKSAAYMADGYARVTGRTGICMAQAVGAANLAAGLQDGYLDRVPILALTGRKPDTHQHRNAYQEVRHAPLYEPVTKFNAEVRTVKDLPCLLGQALRHATTGTFRPAHLDLDGLKGDLVEGGTLAGHPAELNFTRSGMTRPGLPPEDALAAAAARIDTADRPMIVCGVSGHYAKAGAGIKALAEAITAPVATSVGGRSVIETGHSHHFGVVGTYSAPYANARLAEADLVIFVGCHMGDQVTYDWTLPATETPVVQIDTDPAELGRTHPNVFGLAGDLGATCQTLAARCARHPARQDWLSACIGDARDWLAAALDRAAAAEGPIPAERLAHEVGEVLPENGVLVADTGFSATWTAQFTEFRHARQTYLRAAGSLGWAFPAAIGATLGGGRPTVCFTGDGAFYYHMGELETIQRWNVPLVTVINNNAALGQGLRSVKKLYMNRNGNLSDLVEFKMTNFADLARVFGIAGFRVEKPEDIKPTIEKALGLGAPAIVDVVTNPDSNPEPAWRP